MVCRACTGRDPTSTRTRPDYFGANLDALWDALTDLSRPTAVILDRWTEFARARPARWDSIVAVFAERCERDPPFAVVLA